MSRPRADYDAWHDRVSGTDALDTPWHRLVREVLRLEQDLEHKRVLEIACGRGELAAACVSMATPSSYIAADFSISAVRHARDRFRRTGSAESRPGHDRVRFIQADAQAIALPDASIDTVISCETIEHVPDPRAALAELARVLRPGGRLYLTAPNYFGPIGAYRGYLRVTGRRFTEEGQPINNFLIAALVRRWIRSTGLRVIKAASSGHYLPFPGRPPILLVDRSRWLDPFGLHSLTVAEKPR